jgi:exopolyphosphatase/guanosine-5'-triphosphate,3'-diphosphate pyrophosphatase
MPDCRPAAGCGAAARVADELKPSRLVVSSFGIREGLLFDDLGPDAAGGIPLIEGARKQAGISAASRAWLASRSLDRARCSTTIRHAPAAQGRLPARRHRLGAPPDFRAERGVDMALHGNWVGVDGPGRAVLAQALSAVYGAPKSFADSPAARLCRPDALARAAQWGLAVRFGQRLSGGVAAGLERSALRIRDGSLRLELKREDQALYGEAVERRHHTLAAALGLTAEPLTV